MGSEERHLLLGRISGTTGIASFCSCGRAYFGETVTEADERFSDHARKPPTDPAAR